MSMPWRPEPATVTLTVAAWSGLTAFSFLFSKEGIWSRPGFTTLYEMHVPYYGWAGLFLSSGVMLSACLFTKSISFRATSALFSSLLWLFVGITNIISLSHIGILGSFGLWSIFCGLSCLHAVSQWAFYDE